VIVAHGRNVFFRPSTNTGILFDVGSAFS